MNKKPIRTDVGEPRKVYVTKYALTKGIRECAINERWTDAADEASSGRVCVDWENGFNGVLGLARGEWQPTIEAAQARVSEMVAAKLKSLDKQRAKLERLARDGAKVVTADG